MSLSDKLMLSESETQELSLSDSQLVQIFFIQHVERIRYFSQDLLQNFPDVDDVSVNKINQLLDPTIFAWMTADWVG